MLSRAARNIIIAITTGFVLLTAGKSFYLTYHYAAVDLRTRVVGTRLMAAGHSPYFYKWNPADGEFYLDPIDEAGRLVNGNVVTPAVMTVLYPLSRLDYSVIPWIWTALQLLAGFTIIYLLFRQNTFPGTILSSSLILLGFICSDYWFYNIESGQIYIFYTLLFAAMYRCYISKLKYNQFISGFIGGLFLFFRPFAIVIGLGFLLHGKIKWIKGWAAGFLTGCIVFVLPFLSVWADYYAAMQAYITEELGHAMININVQEPVKPAIIEGSASMRHYMVFDLDRFDIVYHWFKRFGITITAHQSLLLYSIVLLILSFFFFRLRKKIRAPHAVFLFGFLVYILAELFTIAPRQGYNTIQWIFPLSLVWLSSRSHWQTIIVLVTSLLLFHQFPFDFTMQGKIAELLFMGLTAYVLFFQHHSRETKVISFNRPAI